MTAVAARWATEHDHRLIEGYAAFCQDMIDAGAMTDRAAGTGCGWPDSSWTSIPIWTGGWPGRFRLGCGTWTG